MKKLPIIAASGLALLCTTEAGAQVREMDSVVIRENRIPSPYSRHNSNIQVIDHKQIMALPVKSVAELLSYVGGVDLRQRGPWGAQADVSIDGSNFDQVLVLVNGVRVSDPQTGHNMMNLPLPVSAIDHIEVLRGPAARIYGVNALAGAINIITRQPVENRVYAQAYAGSSFRQDTASGETYFSRGTQATATFAGQGQSHMVSLAQDHGNGYRYNTRMEAYRAFYQGQVKLSDKHSLEAMGGYVSNSFGAGLFYAAPNDKEATEQVQTVIAAVTDRWQPNSRLTITPRINLRYNKDDYIYIRQRPSVYHNVHETNVIGGEINARYQLKKGTLAAGLELRNEQISSNSLGKRDRRNQGLFAEYKHYFSDRLNAGAGIYLNQNSDYGFQAYPALDAGYRFLPNWKVFANASTGQRLPTFTDLYYNGPSNIGNPDLKPEVATYTEAGLRYSTGVVEAKASVFTRNSKDFIDWTRPNDTMKWQPQNYQSVITQGATLVWNYQLSRHLKMPAAYDLSLNVNYTWLDQRLEVKEGQTSKYSIDALRHQLNVSLNTWFFKSLQVNITSRYLKRISNNDYTVLDARIGYRMKQWMVYIDANNLLDQQYRETGSVPMPGRWFTFGAKFDGLWFRTPEQRKNNN